MNKKIKVIELYNMIANEEKIPKRIKYDGEVYHHNIYKTNYFRDDNGSTLSFIDLNDEVEILEDNTEEIEEIEQNWVSMDGLTAREFTSVENILKDKINELVRRINYIERKINEN